MSDQTDRYIELLTPFGLTQDEAKIYLCLSEKGALTALQISREIRIARTKVYRLLDKLLADGLVIQILHSRGLKFQAQSPKKLDLLIAKRESELSALKSMVPTISEMFGSFTNAAKNSEVKYFQGIEGLKQVTWNSAQAKSELRIFEIYDMSSFLDYGFCEEVREEFARNHVQIKELSNQKHMPGWTNVTAHVRNWQARYIDPKLLKMKFEMLIYDDVHALYNYHNNDIFCIEIHNKELADMQRQIFDFMWVSARKMKVLNDHGEAVLA